MRPVPLLALAAVVLLCLGCYVEPVAIATPSPTPVPRVTILPTGSLASPTETATPPETATPAMATPSVAASPMPTAVPGGSPSVGCVNGWTSPGSGSTEFDAGMAILEGSMGVTGPWSVTEMRYFSGPDSPGVIEPRFESVERWYIRAGLVSDPAFRGRWLIERRSRDVLSVAFQGVAAVASWESSGYESPGWTGFIGEGEPQTYIGLPGQWSGIPFDFVTGEGDGGQPGLPPKVVDCLAGT